MALISGNGGVRPPAQSSRPQNTAVGSGSRPVPSKVKIDTGSPDDPQTMGRWRDGDGDGKALK